MVNEESSIRLLVADDSEETRASIRKLLSLESDIEVVGEASNGLEAVEKIKALRPNVVLMDIRMPGAGWLRRYRDRRRRAFFSSGDHDVSVGNVGSAAPGDAGRSARVPGQAIRTG